MNLLRIHQTWAKIGLNSQMAQLKLQIKEPFLELKTTHLKVKLEREPARVECDATKCWEERGFKTIATFGRGNAHKGREACAQHIREVVTEGDMMAAIESNSIEDCIAYYASLAWDTPEFNIALVPKSRVDIKVIPGELKIDWELGKVRGNLRWGKVSGNYIKPELQIYLREKASIKIEYVGSRIDTYR